MSERTHFFFIEIKNHVQCTVRLCFQRSPEWFFFTILNVDFNVISGLLYSYDEPNQKTKETFLITKIL